MIRWSNPILTMNPSRLKPLLPFLPRLKEGLYDQDDLMSRSTGMCESDEARSNQPPSFKIESELFYGSASNLSSNTLPITPLV